MRREEARPPAFDFADPPAVIRFALDADDAGAAEELRAQLRRYLVRPDLGPGEMAGELGLLTTPEEWRRYRDLELCRAASYVMPAEGLRPGRPGSSADRHVAALRSQILAFLAHRWPAWSGRLAEPEYCLPVYRHLFRAARCRCRIGGRGEVLPTSRAALKRIIGGN